jgi:hypothetical protein
MRRKRLKVIIHLTQMQFLLKSLFKSLSDHKHQIHCHYHFGRQSSEKDIRNESLLNLLR